MLLKSQIEALEHMHNIRSLVLLLVAKIIKVLLENSDKQRQVFLALLVIDFYLLADALTEIEEELAEPQRKQFVLNCLKLAVLWQHFLEIGLEDPVVVTFKGHEHSLIDGMFEPKRQLYGGGITADDSAEVGIPEGKWYLFLLQALEGEELDHFARVEQFSL